MRYIDEDKLWKAISDNVFKECTDEYWGVLECIEQAPVADVVSRELYEQMRYERDLNQQLYEALLKDVNDYQGVICNYCFKDQTDRCISPNEAVLACGQFEWRAFNHDNTKKKREKYGEIKLKNEQTE